MKLEFQKLKFFEKIYFKFLGKFLWYSSYHEQLDFIKIEDLKGNRSLYISKTIVDCNIICKNVIFGYFFLT